MYREAEILGFLVVAEAGCAPGAGPMLAQCLLAPAILTGPRPVCPALLETAKQAMDTQRKIMKKTHTHMLPICCGASQRKKEHCCMLWALSHTLLNASTHRAALSEKPVTVFPTVSWSFDCQLKPFILTFTLLPQTDEGPSTS